MGNCCFNSHVFYTKDTDRSELARLHKNLAAVMEVPSDVKHGVKIGCLRKVAMRHGVDTEKVSCYGEITDLEDEYNLGHDSFSMHSETASVPTAELWDAVVAQYNGVSHVYMAEEAVDGIYINTDTEGTYIPDKYMLDIWGDAPIPTGWFPGQENPGCLEISEYFDSFESLVEFCVKTMGRKFETVEELEKYLTDTFGDDDSTCASINEFTAT